MSGGKTAKADPDIVETAAAAGDFSTLTAALESAGLVATLRSDGPYTVFAPTDAAFRKLPAGTVEDLLKPENKDRLTKILTYHVVAGRVPASEARKLHEAKTLEGSSFRIRSSHGKLNVDDATVVKADIGARNGVIHVIDTVLIPN
ncbi:MAG: fasciclin domain-containing protein [Planctomycetota bacterium]